MTAAELVPVAPISGSITPRVATRRPVGRSEGGRVVRWASEVLGMTPRPWQEWVLRRGLVRNSGHWANRTVSVLVSRQQGKTTLATIRALAGMVLFGEQVVGAAQNRDIALEAWREALQVADDAGLGLHTVRLRNGAEEFWIGRSRYKITSSTRRGGRGLRADLVILDEVREFRDWEGWSALEKTRRARPTSQLWAVSTEGDEGSVVLNSLAAAGRGAAMEGTPTDSAWFEWSAPPDMDRFDPSGWAAANPELGGLISYETIASEAEHDAPEVFETEVLCRRVPTLRPWLPGNTWDLCTDTAATVPDGADVIFSLAAGPELRHATIAVAWRRPDGKIHVEGVAGYADVDGPVLARAGVRLAELCATWKPGTVAVRKGSAADAAATRALEDQEETALTRVGGVDSLAAANGFYEAVLARRLVHPPDPLTAAHLEAVTSDGLWTRRSRAADIDAAIALCLAHHVTVHQPRPTTWTAF